MAPSSSQAGARERVTAPPLPLFPCCPHREKWEKQSPKENQEERDGTQPHLSLHLFCEPFEADVSPHRGTSKLHLCCCGSHFFMPFTASLHLFNYYSSGVALLTSLAVGSFSILSPTVEAITLVLQDLFLLSQAAIYPLSLSIKGICTCSEAHQLPQGGGMKYHLLPDKLLTQVQPNPGFWIIQWDSFAMFLLGTGLWRCLSSHPRAGKTAGDIQTWSFPPWLPLGHLEEIPTLRMGFCRNNLTHCPLQSTAVYSHICACCPWLCPTVSLLTHRRSANSGVAILVNESPNSSTWESFCTSWQVLEGDPGQHPVTSHSPRARARSTSESLSKISLSPVQQKPAQQSLIRTQTQGTWISCCHLLSPISRAGPALLPASSAPEPPPGSREETAGPTDPVPQPPFPGKH